MGDKNKMLSTLLSGHACEFHGVSLLCYSSDLSQSCFLNVCSYFFVVFWKNELWDLIACHLADFSPYNEILVLFKV